MKKKPESPEIVINSDRFVAQKLIGLYAPSVREARELAVNRALAELSQRDFALVSAVHKNLHGRCQATKRAHLGEQTVWELLILLGLYIKERQAFRAEQQAAQEAKG